MKRVNFGVTLGQRALGFGAATADDLLDVGKWADDSPAFDAVFVGDSYLAKPRLESVALLSAVAGRTKEVRLGLACMASFPLRDPIWLAYQWASLDVLSNGRTIMVPCIGGGGRSAQGAYENEFKAARVDPKTRARRMEEGIEVVRRLWAEDHVTHQGEFYQFEDVSMGPKPVQQPIPIWLVSNVNLFTDDPELRDRPLRRTARLGDGWQTAATSPELTAENWSKIRGYAAEYGRDPDAMDCCVQLVVNINDDAEYAFQETKRFLDLYYENDWSREELERWGAWGSLDDCVEKLGRWIDAGANWVTLRLTTWDSRAQFKIVSEELIPRLRERAARVAGEAATTA